eukprot:8859939-Pyramimonas_sp.AAC.1
MDGGRCPPRNAADASSLGGGQIRDFPWKRDPDKRRSAIETTLAALSFPSFPPPGSRLSAAHTYVFK